MTSARDLSARLADLLTRERAALGEFLVALADFDRRRRWLELGHSSLFYFLHRELGLSKGAAFYRKTAAELIQRFPEIVEPLRDGRLCLTSVVELRKVLTPENRDEVLPRFFQLSKQEAKAVSAALRPDEAAPHREVVTALRARAVSPALSLPAGGAPEGAAAALTQSAVHPDEPRPCQEGPNPAPTPISPPRTSVEPLTADLRRLHVTVSRRFLAKLDGSPRRPVALASGCGRGRDPGSRARSPPRASGAKRRGLVEKPRREPPAAKPDHVPAHVKRAVWKRDDGRCQWPVTGGGVCGSTHQVELDHVVPRGRGGPPTIENARLLCRVHNQYAARQVYGGEWMDRFTRTAVPASSDDDAAAGAPP